MYTNCNTCFYRERVCNSLEETEEQSADSGRDTSSTGSSRVAPPSQPCSKSNVGQDSTSRNGFIVPKDSGGTTCKAHLLRSASIGAPKCPSARAPKYEVGVRGFNLYW